MTDDDDNRADGNRADNPFDQIGLDPTMGPDELTERLRHIAERLPPDQRTDLRALWRKLTLNDSDRIRWAIFAHRRDGDTGVSTTGELRRSVPPLIDRRDPPALDATVADVLLDFGGPANVPEQLLPAADFEAIARQGQAGAPPTPSQDSKGDS